jgi:hypothetical protein
LKEVKTMKEKIKPEPVTCASRKRGNVHKLEFRGNIANSITTINTDSMVAIPKGYENRQSNTADDKQHGDSSAAIQGV